jgi:hypothetical protein
MAGRRSRGSWPSGRRSSPGCATNGAAACSSWGGLFFLGVYGGDAGEGVAAWDHHDPPRFFSWRTDEQLRRFAEASFDVVDFHVASAGDHRFQSLTLRRPYPGATWNGSSGPTSHPR